MEQQRRSETATDPRTDDRDSPSRGWSPWLHAPVSPRSPEPPTPSKPDSGEH
jgi:hypothetical protein